MKAAIFRGGNIVVDTLPVPVPGQNQVLVKVLCCGICGSDLHAAKHAACPDAHSARMARRRCRSQRHALGGGMM